MNLAFVLLLSFTCDAPFNCKNSIELFRETSEVKNETDFFSRLTSHFPLFQCLKCLIPVITIASLFSTQ